MRRHGIQAWHSEKHIRGAHEWHDEIGKALQRCDWFVVVLSPQSVRSKWVKRELLYARNDERYENRILPVVLRACQINELSWTLKQFQMVFFTGERRRAYREFFRTWGIEFAPLSSENAGDG